MEIPIKSIFCKIVLCCLIGIIGIPLFAQQPVPKAKYVHLSGGFNQLITVKNGDMMIPGFSGFQGTFGVGPIWRFVGDGHIGIHRALGVGDRMKSGYLFTYGWRAGFFPFKFLPLIVYGGGGNHDYYLNFRQVELGGQQVLPAAQSHRPTDYVTFGASYSLFRCFELDLSFRREPYFRNKQIYNANYISIGVNAWLYKYDKFARVKEER
jgi:hypothetical protein